MIWGARTTWTEPGISTACGKSPKVQVLPEEGPAPGRDDDHLRTTASPRPPLPLLSPAEFYMRHLRNSLARSTQLPVKDDVFLVPELPMAGQLPLFDPFAPTNGDPLPMLGLGLGHDPFGLTSTLAVPSLSQSERFIPPPLVALTTNERTNR
ncbi:hypothetical protein PAPYR_8275 [Paratrimastix pyriformis]|uniref:Uncharacterized protein n=1 Tax=Paratrimastix pyriformis TaxID=342808 RepID=A0ABQ8UGK5_9EUKA|nr:hypothetical protein PAPYR_8275 [Paratrimastix pyriformis]